MMKKSVILYEIIYLIGSNFTQQEIARKVDYYQAFLTARGSQVLTQNRGKRYLSYPINGNESANYIQMVYTDNGKIGNELQKELYRDESVLRNLITRLPTNNPFVEV